MLAGRFAFRTYCGAMRRRPLSYLLAGVALAGASLVGAHAAAQGPVHVRLTSEPDGVWLHDRVAADRSATWTAVCAAPCDAVVPPYASFGLSLDGRRPQLVTFPIVRDGDVLTLRFEDHSLTRAVGGIAFFVGAACGLVAALIGSVRLIQSSAAGARADDGDIALAAAGIGTLALGLSLGIAFSTDGDRVEVVATPAG